MNDSAPRSGCANKHKAAQSRKKSGYYKQQFTITSANKRRRAVKRQAKARMWADRKQREAEAVNATIGMAKES